MKFINLVVTALLFAQPLMAADPGEEGAALAASAGLPVYELVPLVDEALDVLHRVVVRLPNLHGVIPELLTHVFPNLVRDRSPTPLSGFLG